MKLQRESFTGNIPVVHPTSPSGHRENPLKEKLTTVESLNVVQIAGLSFPVLRHIPLFAKDELQIGVEISLKYIFQIILDSYDYFFQLHTSYKGLLRIIQLVGFILWLDSNEILMFANATKWMKIKISLVHVVYFTGQMRSCKIVCNTTKSFVSIHLKVFYIYEGFHVLSQIISHSIKYKSCNKWTHLLTYFRLIYYLIYKATFSLI